MREENAEDPGEREGELQKLGAGMGERRGIEWVGPLGSQEPWGRGGGRTIPAAGSPRPRGCAESWSRRPALPFLLVPDAEAASGEAAPRSHQPQPRRAEAAAAGTDPRPGQSFRTPKHPVLASQGFHLGGDKCWLHWRSWLLSPALGIPSQTPSCSQNAIFLATLGSVSFTPCSVNFPQGGSVSTSGSVNSSSSFPLLPNSQQGGEFHSLGLLL